MNSKLFSLLKYLDYLAIIGLIDSSSFVRSDFLAFFIQAAILERVVTMISQQMSLIFRALISKWVKLRKSRGSVASDLNAQAIPIIGASHSA
jgi:hypothetical protein